MPRQRLARLKPLLPTKNKVLGLNASARTAVHANSSTCAVNVKWPMLARQRASARWPRLRDSRTLSRCTDTVVVLISASDSCSEVCWNSARTDVAPKDARQRAVRRLLQASRLAGRVGSVRSVPCGTCARAELPQAAFVAFAPAGAFRTCCCGFVTGPALSCVSRALSSRCFSQILMVHTLLN